MAPEMWDEKMTVGRSADSWGLGAVICQMLTGVKPFGKTGETDPMKLKNHICGKRRGFWSRLFRRSYNPADHINGMKQFKNKTLSAEAQDFINHLLEKDPEDRPTATQMKQHAWFKGFDWDKLKTREHPQVPKYGVCSDEKKIQAGMNNDTLTNNIIDRFAQKLSGYSDGGECHLLHLIGNYRCYRDHGNIYYAYESKNHIWTKEFPQNGIGRLLKKDNQAQPVPDSETRFHNFTFQVKTPQRNPALRGDFWTL